MVDAFQHLAREKYISVETFRKSGTGVSTPVWFAHDGGTLYMYTMADSGKAKRIRNNPRIRVAPCDVRGRLKGDWIEGTARILSGAEAARANALLSRKYWLKRVFDLAGPLRRGERVAIAIMPPSM